MLHIQDLSWTAFPVLYKTKVHCDPQDSSMSQHLWPQNAPFTSFERCVIICLQMLMFNRANFEGLWCLGPLYNPREWRCPGKYRRHCSRSVHTGNHPKESGMPLPISNVCLAQLFGLSFANSSSGFVFLVTVESVHVSKQVGARVEETAEEWGRFTWSPGGCEGMASSNYNVGC